MHAEISDTSVDLINDTFGAAMQRKFNDQSSPYQNYNTYDLFAPVFGDSVPSRRAAVTSLRPRPRRI